MAAMAQMEVMGFRQFFQIILIESLCMKIQAMAVMAVMAATSTLFSRGM